MIRIYVANSSNVLTDVSQYLNLWPARVVSVTQNAEEQSVATSSIVFEDPTGVLELVGLRDIVIEEDAATFKRIWRGQIGDRRITRGPYRAGSTARIWTCDLEDLNTRMYWRVGEGNVSRPAETDVARMQYLMTQLVITDIVGDTSTYFSTANPVAMDAANYEGQYITDYINDCLQATTQFSKNCYLLDVSDGSGGYKVAIWYGPSTLTTFSSAIKISNVLADVDNSTVFAPLLDAELARSPSRVYSGVRVNYDSGAAYVTRAATASVYFATRDTVYDAVNVKTSAKAIARGTQQLVTMATEDDIITCAIEVPASQVNDVRAGMRIQAKFSHFTTAAADYSSGYVWFRVLNRTVTLITPVASGDPGRYEIALTLSPQSTSTGSVSTCTTQIAGPLAATLWDSGDVLNGGAGVPPITFANGLHPSDPAQAYLAVAVWEGRRTDTSALTLDGGAMSHYTMLHNTREGNVIDQGSIGFFGWEAVAAAATPGDLTVTFTPSWTGGFTGGGVMRSLAVLVATASTSPVQKSNVGGGSTVTFPGGVSAGNLVIAGFIHEGPAATMPVGWTTLGNVQMAVGTGGTQLTLIAKCMTGAEGATLTLVNASEQHWWMAVEVAIT